MGISVTVARLYYCGTFVSVTGARTGLPEYGHFGGEPDPGLRAAKSSLSARPPPLQYEWSQNHDEQAKAKESIESE